MDIKMIVMDLDRTLMNNDKTISEYSLRILDKCKREGIKLVIATARPTRFTKNYAEQLSVEDYICINSASIVINNKVFETNKIDKKIAKKIVNDIYDNYPNKELSIDFDDEFLYSDVQISGFGDSLKIYDCRNVDKDVSRIFLCEVNNDEKKMIDKLLPPEVYSSISCNKYYQIFSKESTKLNGIKTLAEYYNISLHEIAAFGDDNDDIEMIRECGCGVAVANAIDSVLEVAKYVAESNEDDGVCKFIELNIL